MVKLARRVLPLCVLLWAEGALADTPPDVVMTHDGGMVRGTIIEKVPGSHVDITLTTGENRRFDMRRVQYAGPAGSGSGAAAGPGGAGAQVHGPQVRVRLHGNEAGLTFQKRTGTSYAIAYGYGGAAVAMGARFDELCTAPCEVSLPAGAHTLALSRPGEVAVAAPPVTVSRDATLYGTYHDNSGVRAIGWVLLIGGLVGGTVLTTYSLTKLDSNDDTIPMEFWLGLGLMTLGPLASLPFLLQNDEAEIGVGPYDAAASPGQGSAFVGADMSSRRSPPAPGLALTARF